MSNNDRNKIKKITERWMVADERNFLIPMNIACEDVFYLLNKNSELKETIKKLEDSIISLSKE